MTIDALSGAQLLIDDEKIPYLPNSLKPTFGNAEADLRVQVVGDGAVSHVPTQNFETAKANIMFDMISNEDNLDILNTFADNLTNSITSVIKIILKSGKTFVYETCILVNNPEIDMGAEGVISIEFQGARKAFA